MEGSNELQEHAKLLVDPAQCEAALKHLVKKKNTYPDLGWLLWNTFGSVLSLLKVVFSGYSLIDTKSLSWDDSTRICNALSLLEAVATEPRTVIWFIKAHLPIYLYPLLTTKDSTREFEYVRLTGLGVVGAILKTGNKDATAFLISTEITPLILYVIERCSDLSKTVSLFILHQLLCEKTGIDHICADEELLMKVVHVLNETATDQIEAEAKNARIIKAAFKCYSELFKNKEKGRLAHKTTSKEFLNDKLILKLLHEEEISLLPYIDISFYAEKLECNGK
uniref:CCR4 NOT complex subunit Rcd1 Caf40 n=1 Tax=Metchnikovella dogieli TaxID=2804710 RepID=A0A896WLE6_9MICR|nr:CCR4 NOT complex subunit Rcd1 Caf40 [Metchnikovella dogieli]